MRILLADDELARLNYLDRVLRAAGYDPAHVLLNGSDRSADVTLKTARRDGWDVALIGPLVEHFEPDFATRLQAILPQCRIVMLTYPTSREQLLGMLEPQRSPA